MQCRICGEERGVSYHADKRQTLCAFCAADTPSKVGGNQFDRLYWGVEFGTVPESTRREFYDDYLASTHNVPDYIRATTSVVE